MNVRPQLVAGLLLLALLPVVLYLLDGATVVVLSVLSVLLVVGSLYLMLSPTERSRVPH